MVTHIKKYICSIIFIFKIVKVTDNIFTIRYSFNFYENIICERKFYQVTLILNPDKYNVIEVYLQMFTFLFEWKLIFKLFL